MDGCCTQSNKKRIIVNNNDNLNAKYSLAVNLLFRLFGLQASFAKPVFLRRRSIWKKMKTS